MSDRDHTFTVRPVGWIESLTTNRQSAPRQPDEDAPPAVLVLDDAVHAAVDGLRIGDRIVVLTWLHLARRDELTTRPRNDPDAALTGVFATRSPDRPNPIGLHDVEITGTDGLRISVNGLEAIDGTPILDIKPVLGPPGSR
jgi:tRNA-Thr(GGU) m(6)t(6)A37 methyltransferase TsaA